MNQKNKLSSNSEMKVVEVADLSFKYEKENFNLFEGLSLNLQLGKFVVLAGRNGVGKSTLLRLLAGKAMTQQGTIKILGKDPFYETLSQAELSLVEGVLGIDLDIEVRDLFKNIPPGFRENHHELCELLEVDLNWRMHKVSSGQRRRVDLLLSLQSSPKLFLLDEVTADLDVYCRSRLLNWLKLKTKKNHASVIFATHIFDGMDRVMDDLLFLSRKKLGERKFTSIVKHHGPVSGNILEIVERWHQEDAALGV